MKENGKRDAASLFASEFERRLLEFPSQAFTKRGKRKKERDKERGRERGRKKEREREKRKRERERILLGRQR